MNKKTIYILLFLAILVGTFFRSWKAATIPFPPNGDELSFGYYGWSLSHFGTDEYGNFLPVYFPSVGDYKYPVLAYMNILPDLLFGLSEFSVRFWSLISGILLIPVVFLISRFIFKSNSTGIASAWLIALSPWSISLSRYGYENNVAITITSGAILFLFLATESRKKTFFLTTSFLLLLISSFTYGAQRIFIPLILFSFFLISYLKESPFLKIRKHLLVFFIILSVVIGVSLIPWQSRGRASGVVWTSLSPDEANQLEESKIEAGISPIHIPPRLTQIFHNKPRIAFYDFLERYINHFGPSFLFFKGEASVERIPQMGQLLLIEIFLLPIGLMTIFNKSSTKKGSLAIIAWLISAPVASALTVGEPHINRASIMIPPLSLISGFGFIQLAEFFKKNYLKKAMLILIISLTIYSSAFMLNQLFVHKSVHQPWIREQVNKEMAEDIFRLKDKYQAVVLSKTDNEYMFFLFYNKISPQEFIKNSDISKESQENQWHRVNRMYNIFFKMPYDCPKSGKLKVLYVCTGPNIPQNAKIIKVIRFLDKVPAYTYVEFYPLSQMPASLPSLPEGLKYMVDTEKSPKIPDGIIPESYDGFW